MVSKTDEVVVSPTMTTVINYLKRASSSEDCAASKEEEAEKEEVHNNKKAREVETTTTNNSNRNNSNSNKLTVTFSSKNDEVFEIARRTKEEKSDMHMTREDQDLILRDIVEAMRRFNNNNNNDSDNHSDKNNDNNDNDNYNNIKKLGLEGIMEQQDSDRIERVKSAVCVILKRQRKLKSQLLLLKSITLSATNNKNNNMHKNKNMHNNNNISQININESWLKKHYRPFSELSAKLARNRGLRDQEMAPSPIPRKIVMSR